MIIRRIDPSDNPEVGKIIRQVLTEFGANREGFAWQDPEIDTMAEAYTASNQAYFVIEKEGKVVGGGGISSFSCHLENCCELQKMYLLPEARGQSLGAQLIDTLLKEAHDMKYQFCYLETLNTMSKALALYHRKGFDQLESPLGNTGHNACDNWFLLDLEVFFAKLTLLSNRST